MIVFLKIVHTLIWAVVTAANFLAFYFAFIGRFDLWFWLCAGLLALEVLIIMLNNWKCPISEVIERYSKGKKTHGFNLYLPGWLAKYNVRIYSVLIPLEILIVCVKQFFFRV